MQRTSRAAFFLCCALVAGRGPSVAMALSQPEAGATWTTNVHFLGINGSNVAVAFVEAYIAAYTYRINPQPTNGWGGEYWPSTNVFLGKTISYYDDGDPLDTNYSTHATKVAMRGVGNPLGWGSANYIGTAHGATDIPNHSANRFMNHYLGLGLNPPGHSFSLAFATSTNDQQIWTALMDSMVDQYSKVVVMGLPTTNQAASYGGTHPAGLAAAFNIVTVGCCDSAYTNWGYSTQYGPAAPHGHAKPDLLTDATSGSEAAGRGAGIAALLLHQAARDGWTNGSDPRAVKAILLAGARKTTPWDKGAPGTNDDHYVPLDYYAGAGIAHCLNNYGIMYGGEVAIGSTNRRAAWDLGIVQTNQTNVYLLTIPQTNISVSAALAWNRRVGAATNLPDLNLHLYSATNGSLETLLDWSTSTVDSVEHVYWLSPATGLVALAVSGKNLSTAETYALAFQFVAPANQPLLDADADDVPDAFETAHFKEIYIHGTHGDPDADGAGNYEEYMADTLPTNTGSVFALLDVTNLSASAYTVAFAGSTGRQYRIEYCSEFAGTNNWTWTEATDWFAGSGSVTNWVDDGSETEPSPTDTTGRLYRARVILR